MLKPEGKVQLYKKWQDVKVIFSSRAYSITYVDECVHSTTKCMFSTTVIIYIIFKKKLDTSLFTFVTYI